MQTHELPPPKEAPAGPQRSIHYAHRRPEPAQVALPASLAHNYRKVNARTGLGEATAFAL